VPTLFRGAVGSICKSGLLYSRTAALNEYHQHDYKQNTGNDPDNCGTVHCDFLPL